MALQAAIVTGEGVGRWAVSWRFSRASWLTKWRSDAVGSVCGPASMSRSSGSSPAAAGRGRAGHRVLRDLRAVARRVSERGGSGEVGTSGDSGVLWARGGASVSLMASSCVVGTTRSGAGGAPPCRARALL